MHILYVEELASLGFAYVSRSSVTSRW